MIVASIPLPPSANHILVSVGRRRVKSPAYKAWIVDASACLRDSEVEPIRGVYSVEIVLPAIMRGDVDNRVKPILDLLVRLKLTPDDRKATEVNVWRHDSATFGPPAGTCLIKVRSVPRDAGIGAAEGGRAPDAFALNPPGPPG